MIKKKIKNTQKIMLCHNFNSWTLTPLGAPCMGNNRVVC
jgi:hypothetical protein